MAGINHGGQRPKSSKHLRAGSNKKRHKNTTEAQAKYHAAIALRRSKKMKKK
jgi:hypothetical protein